MDGVGATARFYFPGRLAIDAGGNIYVADRFNVTIRKIDASHAVTTLAGAALQRGSVDGTGSAARFSNLQGIAVDGAGIVYVVDGQSIRRIAPSGAVTTLAGGPDSGSDDGAGPAARFNFPGGIAADSAGNLYVADAGNRTIRKITPGGLVTTFAGAAGQSGSADGAGSAARFAAPGAVATDAAGNVYVADEANQTIRKISPAGFVTTLAGKPGISGNANGPALEATFRAPLDIAADALGNVYVIDYADSSIPYREIRKITAAGIVSTLAGLLDSELVGLAVSPDGSSVYVSSPVRNAVQSINPAGEATTIAGAERNSGNVDGPGIAARFGSLLGAAADSQGNVYVADAAVGIRKITRDAQVSTIWAWAPPAIVTSVATDAEGNVYAGDANCPPIHGSFIPECQGTIRKIAPGGATSVISPTGSSDGTGTQIGYPVGMAIDAAGNIFVAVGNRYVVRKIAANGDVTTLAGTAGFMGVADGVGSAARFASLRGIAVDSGGDVFVTDAFRIRRISATGVVVTLAGSPDPGSVDGAATAARFSLMSGIALDGSGALYVADTGNHTIRKVTPSGVVTTVVGAPGLQGFVPGALPGVLSAPTGVAVNGSDLYITMSTAVAVVRNRP